MTTLEQIEHWGDTHHPAWLDIVRIFLGVLLFMKGVSFIGDTTYLATLIQGLHFNAWTVVAVHYVAFAHLVGGLMILLGCLTRTASIAQLPIMIVAVFFTNLRNGFSYLNSELWLSVFVLIMLMIFSVIGSGGFSFDEFVKRNTPKRN